MNLIDNHCHLQHEKYNNIREKVIEKIYKSMKYVVISGANPQWNICAVEMFGNKDRFLITLGIHPVDSTKMNEKEFEEALEFIKKAYKEYSNIVGIGEIGMDFHWVKDPSKQKIMKERFIRQIELANELSLPIVTHSWDADEIVLNIAQKYKKDNKVAMHCFSKYKLLDKVQNIGYMIDISTNILKNKNVKKSAKKANLENILVETDSPYLSPYEGELNYPWNVKLVLEKIAELKNIEYKKVEEKVYMNFINFYEIKE